MASQTAKTILSQKELIWTEGANFQLRQRCCLNDNDNRGDAAAREGARSKKWFRYDAADKRLFKELQKTLAS